MYFLRSLFFQKPDYDKCSFFVEINRLTLNKNDEKKLIVIFLSLGTLFNIISRFINSEYNF